MKCIFIFFFNLLFPIFSVIPLWNFSSSANDLLSNSDTYSYTIYSKSGICTSDNVELIKTITRSGNSITYKNKLIIGSVSIDVDWEDIESIYCINNLNYICPKGSFHMYKFKDSNLYAYTPDGFSDQQVSEWDLICYKQEQNNVYFMFMGYLNSKSKFYSYRFYDSETNGNQFAY